MKYSHMKMALFLLLACPSLQAGTILSAKLATSTAGLQKCQSLTQASQNPQVQLESCLSNRSLFDHTVMLPEFNAAADSEGKSFLSKEMNDFFVFENKLYVNNKNINTEMREDRARRLQNMAPNFLEQLFKQSCRDSSDRRKVDLNNCGEYASSDLVSKFAEFVLWTLTNTAWGGFETAYISEISDAARELYFESVRMQMRQDQGFKNTGKAMARVYENSLSLKGLSGR